ncbi:MAG: hypothetical protein ACK46A_14000 [Akkermansiaceae bacterium]|jgi:hypothetical protein
MRIYFDENFSHRIVAGMREFQQAKPSEGVTVIWAPDEFGRGAADEDWIPQVAAKHGIIITQDLNIHRISAQWELCQRNKVGLFFFKPPRGGWGFWNIIREVVNRWDEIKSLSEKQKRPFGYMVEHHRKQMRPL